MTATDRTSLKAFFETGDRPTQSQFADLIDSALILAASTAAGLHSTASLQAASNLEVSQSGSIITYTGASNASFAGSILLSGTLRVTASQLFTGSLVTGGAASFAGSIVVNGAASINASATINGTACVSGSIIVNNVLILTGSGTGTNGSRIIFYDPNIAHGMTALTPTTAFGEINRYATCGGVQIRGFSGSTVGFLFTGVSSSPDAGKSTGAHGYFHLRAACSNGTGQQAAGANENLVVVQSFLTTRFIFDADGDFHADAAVSASSYDSHDDIGLVRSLEVERAKQTSVGLREEFGTWARYNKSELERLKIATFNDGRPGRDNDGSVFVNYTALTRLHSGAIWQLAQKISDLEKKLLPSGCNYIDLLDTS